MGVTTPRYEKLMATTDTDNLTAVTRGLTGMPLSRRLLFWGLLGASLVLSVAVIVWAWAPHYSHLGYTISGADVGRIMQTLQQAGIHYRVDDASGAIRVPDSRLAAAHHALSEAGLPHERATPGAVAFVPYAGMNPFVPAAQSAAVGQAPLDAAQRLEANYKQRIEDILTPIIGAGGVRAQVSVELAADAGRTGKQAATSSRLHKLSIAVVVDNRQIHDGEVMTRRPLSEAELERVTALVRDAVGFDEARGDTLNVLNAAFASSAAHAAGQPVSAWQQDGLWDAARKLTAVVLALVIIFGVLRPILRELQNKRRDLRQLLPPDVLAQLETTDFSLSSAERAAGARRRAVQEQITTARMLATQDPRRVAQVLRSWMGSR